MGILEIGIVESKERVRTHIFSRGIEESALSPSSRPSTRARLSLPLDQHKDQVLSSGYPFSKSGSVDSKPSTTFLGHLTRHLLESSPRIPPPSRLVDAHHQE
jgi:hypothetical protein